MAASSAEKDYVHQSVKLLNTVFPNASYATAQCAKWETGMDYSYLNQVKNYNADIVIILLGDNISESEHFLSCGKNIPVFISKPFMWQKPLVAKAIDKAAHIANAVIMDMSDIGKDITNRAVGKFKHSGVASHPGDKGMYNIANKIFEYVSNFQGDKNYGL